ncbi:hypothetical protein HXX76_013395 [Chlamydomonas incerta]|uniref:Uncharacterized protein n=1 Tax=Chlamydomonas incerta TaxID=51695 RepID=A0A835VS51_CHLIN|nr:hypothetical protein HXX76_013395 [Chlamydomonas incerta]|eukprot:KAG2425770.1 hypothetical protein HXX76_013395 [Chlamydomonas incerta]
MWGRPLLPAPVQWAQTFHLLAAPGALGGTIAATAQQQQQALHVAKAEPGAGWRLGQALGAAAAVAAAAK